jgi:hypothetical protein
MSYTSLPKAREEYENSSDYYKHLYHYLKEFGGRIWRDVRKRGEKTPKENLEEILEFYVSVNTIRRDAEKDHGYWRNGVIDFCEGASKRIVNKLLKMMKRKRLFERFHLFSHK